ncbi:DNA polymerase beta domain protein region [[Clostridium] ultunense Esp]|nr:DNA polymerase beta domain protein region [[Clostridium] ultunense Esp]
MNPFGISEKSYQLLLDAFRQHAEVEEVILFGSRAKGNHKKGSDIDLAIKGKHCSPELALQLQTYLNEELPIPYMVDVVDYNSLSHKELKEHIDRVGKKLYPEHLVISPDYLSFDRDL